MSTINRRHFLKGAGIAGLVGVPALLGARLLAESQGDPLPDASPLAAPVQPSASGEEIRAAHIVVLSNTAAQPNFAPFLGEILRAEGVLGFVEASLAGFDWAALRPEQTVLLGEGTLSLEQAGQLRAHVERGGGLIAMRPHFLLADVLGVRRSAGNTDDGYLRTSQHAIAAGIDPGPLQVHAPAEHYRATNADVIAWLCDGAGEISDHPAVTLRTLDAGSSNSRGMAAMWAFDLARSVVYTRQGNPAWANQDRDGLDGIRACDMFVGWIDLDRIQVPQADEQQRLLVNLLDAISQRRPAVAPLPRLWYFPERADSLLVATGDSHTNPPGAIERVLQQVEQRGGTMSVYYSPEQIDAPRRAVRRAREWASALPLIGPRLSSDQHVTPADADGWRARGHEFALHPYVEGGLEAGWREYWDAFTGLGLGRFDSTRTHRVLWSGWTDTAQVQAGYDVRMNMDYYHVGPAFQKPDGEWAYGYFTGSGLPMRFVDGRGQLLNIYQQLTPLVDEQVLTMPWASNLSKMDVASAVAISQDLIDRAINGAFAAISTQFHIDPFAIPGPWMSDALQWLGATLDYCEEKGMPIWSAERWTRFTQARSNATTTAREWDAEKQTLTFELALDAGADAKIALLIPARHGAARLVQFDVDGETAATAERQVGGIAYAEALLPGGAHSVAVMYG
jgi:hypothetical protein